jgi:hypothetical protein
MDWLYVTLYLYITTKTKWHKKTWSEYFTISSTELLPAGLQHVYFVASKRIWPASTAFTDIVTRNCHIPAPGRNCMTHRPALTATAVKVIHTTVQLCLTSCKYHWLLLLCVYMVRYTVEQRVFMYGSYVKCGSARKSRGKFRRKFPGITVQSTTGIYEPINKVSPLGHFWIKTT